MEDLSQLLIFTNFHKIIFSDEAHFHLDGYVNKQNCRIWATENPRAIQEASHHPRRVTVWCAFWSHGVIGPFFFENEDDEVAVTVNGPRYREMITSYLWSQLEGIDVGEIWFQQDGAPCHTATATINLLRSKFIGRVISRHGDKEWPPRSCDLTPLDYFLWGFVKDKVYANNPGTICELKANIRAVISEIGPKICENVMDNYGARMRSCINNQGAHMPEIVFHV